MTNDKLREKAHAYLKAIREPWACAGDVHGPKCDKLLATLVEVDARAMEQQADKLRAEEDSHIESLAMYGRARERCQELQRCWNEALDADIRTTAERDALRAELERVRGALGDIVSLLTPFPDAATSIEGFVFDVARDALAAPPSSPPSPAHEVPPAQGEVCWWCRRSYDASRPPGSKGGER